MGRLTLNVLLSFAQFEREVTAERIRDKIAASKKKGMWMGGVVPLGYRVESRKLLIEPTEAQTVRHLFERYLALGSVRALAEEAEVTELRGRMTKGSASTQLGKPFGRGNLYHLLSNPIYIGKIRHRDLIHDGEHQPIIDTDIFARVQALLVEQAPGRSSPESNRRPLADWSRLRRHRGSAQPCPCYEEGKTLPLLRFEPAHRRRQERFRRLAGSGIAA